MKRKLFRDLTHAQIAEAIRVAIYMRFGPRIPHSRLRDWKAEMDNGVQDGPGVLLQFRDCVPFHVFAHDLAKSLSASPSRPATIAEVCSAAVQAASMCRLDLIGEGKLPADAA